jgi:hypothetical protein
LMNSRRFTCPEIKSRVRDWIGSRWLMRVRLLCNYSNTRSNGREFVATLTTFIAAHSFPCQPPLSHNRRMRGTRLVD